MRAYLLAYVINRPALSGYVRERLVQVRKKFASMFWICDLVTYELPLQTPFACQI